MRLLYFLTFIGTFFLTPSGVNAQHIGSDGIFQVSVNAEVQDVPFSNILHFEGFTVLETDQACKITNLEKIIFTGDTLLVLDQNEEGVQRILAFSEKTGRFLGEVGHTTETDDPNNGYKGMRDICIIPGTQTIRCLSAAHKAFIDLDLKGNIVKAHTNGVFGDGIAMYDDGTTFVYNEFNSTPFCGHNFLITYNSNGVKNTTAFPYPPGKENLGYAFTGFITRSGPKIWFNPALSDTLFEIVDGFAQPRYRFDFGTGNIPDSLSTRKLSGPDLLESSYLEEGFVEIGHFAVFPYGSERHRRIGLYDCETGYLLRCHKSRISDPWYELVQFGNISAKGNNQFSVELTSSRCIALIEKSKLNWEMLQNLAPGLFDQIVGIQKGANPILLYFSFKQDSRLGVARK